MPAMLFLGSWEAHRGHRPLLQNSFSFNGLEPRWRGMEASGRVLTGLRPAFSSSEGQDIGIILVSLLEGVA